eukprot:363918-Chlamydomonas_euryale.AAC.3
MAGWLGGWMGGRMDGWMDGVDGMHRYRVQVQAAVCTPQTEAAMHPPLRHTFACNAPPVAPHFCMHPSLERACVSGWRFEPLLAGVFCALETFLSLPGCMMFIAYDVWHLGLQSDQEA